MKRTADLTVTLLVDRVTALEGALLSLRQEVETDPLTGLGNRRALDSRPQEGWFVMADLDGFKRAQDAHPRGHDHGDQILREFAGFLDGTCRKGDHTRDADQVTLRVGGDEFVVRVDSQEGAHRVRDAIRAWRSEVEPAVTASAGLGRDLRAADAAMYIHKTRDRA